MEWYNLEPGQQYLIRDEYATFVAFVWNKEHKQWFLQFDKNGLFTISPLLPYTYTKGTHCLGLNAV
jgi:hypothetical protein